jgi:hypothetical protein
MNGIKLYLDKESLQYLMERNPGLEMELANCAKNWLKTKMLRPADSADLHNFVITHNKATADTIKKNMEDIRKSAFTQEIKDEIKNKAIEQYRDEVQLLITAGLGIDDKDDKLRLQKVSDYVEYEVRRKIVEILNNKKLVDIVTDTVSAKLGDLLRSSLSSTISM